MTFDATSCCTDAITALRSNHLSSCTATVTTLLPTTALTARSLTHSVVVQVTASSAVGGLMHHSNANNKRRGEEEREVSCMYCVVLCRIVLHCCAVLCCVCCADRHAVTADCFGLSHVGCERSNGRLLVAVLGRHRTRIQVLPWQDQHITSHQYSTSHQHISLARLVSTSHQHITPPHHAMSRALGVAVIARTLSCRKGISCNLG